MTAPDPARVRSQVHDADGRERTVRYREFWQLVDEVLGSAHGRVLVHELVLQRLGDRTAEQALDAGTDPRDVWHALCDELDIPDAQRWGSDRYRQAPPARP